MAVNSDEITFGGKPLEDEIPEVTFGQAQPGPVEIPAVSFEGETIDTSLDDRANPGFGESLLKLNENKSLLLRLTKQVLFPGAAEEPDDERLQSSIDFLRATTETLQGAIPTDRGSRITGQVVEEVFGRPISATLEQVGTIYSDLAGADPFDNTSVRLGRLIREGTIAKEFGERDVIDNFTQGLASTLGFAIPGKMLSSSIKGATAVAAWLGAAIGGQAGREDAVAHGATEEQMQIAYWANSTFGLSEGLPIGLVFSRMDDLTGGIFTKNIKNKLVREGTDIFLTGVKGAIEEGLQEGFQTYGENFTASDLANYDPGRSAGENLFTAAATGGSVGFTLNLFAAAIGAQTRRAHAAEIQKRVLDPLGAKTLEEIGGPVSVLTDEYFSVMREIGNIEERIAEAAADDIVRPVAFDEAVGRAEESAGPLSRVTPSATRVRTFEDSISSNDSLAPPESLGLTERQIRLKAAAPVVNKELEGETTVEERIEQTPVTLAVTQQAKEHASLKAQILEQHKILSALEKPTKEERERADMIGETLEEMNFIEKVERQIARDLKSLTASMMKFLPSGSKLFINNYRLLTGEGNQGASFAWTLPTGTKVGGISLSTDRVLETVMDAKRNPTPQNEAQARRAKNEMFTTFLHEFGHQIAFQRFARLGRQVVSGKATEKETNLWRAIQNDYMNFVIQNINAPIGKSISRIFAQPHFSRVVEELSGREGPLPIETSVALSQVLDQAIISEKLSGKSLDYIFSMDEYFAEEFAKIALGNDTLVDPALAPFLREGVEDVKKALETFQGRFRPSSQAIQDYWKLFSLRGKLSSAIEKVQDSSLERDPMLALAKEGIVDPEVLRRLGAESDIFNKFMDIGFNILQIAQLNPHIKGLQDYTQTLRSWKNDVNNNLAVAENRLTEWKNLGQKENEGLARLLLDETLGQTFDGTILKEPRPFTDAEIAAYGLSDEALELRANIKEDFRNSLNQMEEVLVAAKEQIFRDDNVTKNVEVGKVRREFENLRKRPYFPLMRFGEYVLQVRAKGDQTFEGRNYKDGDIVEFQAFDSKPDRRKAFAKERKRFPRDKVTFSQSKMVVPNFSLQGMPLTLLEHLESKMVSSEISEQVREAIRQVKNDVLPFKSFRKQFQKRKKTLGFSLDAQRAYANYMTSFSNHVARVRFDSQFKDNLDSVNDSIKIANRQADADTTKRAEILNHMNEHLNYVMNPVNEFVGLRSAAFFWFLGFNVKSAFVNATQIPLVTYPYLAARYGDGKAVAQLSRANGTAIKLITKPDSVNADIRRMVEQGLNESWLDESLATELAMAASEKNLDKTLPRKTYQHITQKISHYGSLPFHAVEKFNRHVTAIAAYRLARTQGRGHEGAVEEARKAVEKTQFEYARWARPRFQRGKVGGTVFVFQNYMQNALFFALGGDPGAFRMLIMLLLIAGIQGLPFGDNVMDLFDAAATALKKKTGVKDPHTQLRTDLRAALKEAEIDPDLVLHGLSSSTFGLANIGEFMGWPIPDLDLSGSLSMGRIVPGTELLRPGQERTFERTLAQSTERAGGAIVSGAAGIGQAIFDSHPDQWKRWEKAMPAAMRQISKAARFKVRGEEATRGGYPIAGFDMHDTRDQAEIVAQGLGFTPREVGRGWEGFIAKQQAIIYYETWKSSVLRQWNYAHENRDQEAVKAANTQIRKYNSLVPFAELKIGPETRTQSYESYLRSRNFNSKKIEQSRASRRLSSSIEAVFEEGDN